MTHDSFLGIFTLFMCALTGLILLHAMAESAAVNSGIPVPHRGATDPEGHRQARLMFALLVAILVLFFGKEIVSPDLVLFSNDGPLGSLNSQAARTSGLGGTWRDLNWLGGADVSASPDVTYLFWKLCNP